MSHLLSDEAVQIRDLARDFARGEVAGEAAAWDVAGRLPDAPIAALAELGVLGIAAPEAVGGLALGLTELCLVVSELATASATLAAVVAQSTVLAQLMAAAGADEEAAAVVAGARWGLGPLAASPVGAGVEPVKLAHAERLALVVDRDGGPALITCERAQAEVEVWPGGLGLLGLELARVAPPAGVAPTGALSHEALAAARRSAIFGAAAVALGLSRAALAEGAAYAGARKQFGRPIASFQGVGFPLADAATQTDAAELLLFDQAAAADRGRGDGVGAERAKLFACDVAVRAADAALQVHGGYGYTKDYAIERVWRDAKACAVLDGGGAALSAAVAERLVAGGAG